MELTKYGLILGTLAVILAVPLSVVANLLTPHIRDWYGRTSSRRLKKRIALLRERVSKTHSEWTFTPAEWITYHMVVIATLLICLGILSFSGSVLIGLLLFAQKTPSIGGRAFVMLFSIPLLSYVATGVVFIKMTRIAREARELRSLRERSRVEEELKELESREIRMN